MKCLPDYRHWNTTYIVLGHPFSLSFIQSALNGRPSLSATGKEIKATLPLPLNGWRKACLSPLLLPGFSLLPLAELFHDVAVLLELSWNVAGHGIDQWGLPADASPDLLLGSGDPVRTEIA